MVALLFPAPLMLSGAKWFQACALLEADRSIRRSSPMTAFKSGDPLTLNRLYGRSSGHKLRKSQQELVEKLLPQIEVPPEDEVTARRLFGDDGFERVVDKVTGIEKRLGIYDLSQFTPKI